MMGTIYEYAKNLVLYKNDKNFTNFQSKNNHIQLILGRIRFGYFQESFRRF